MKKSFSFRIVFLLLILTVPGLGLAPDADAATSKNISPKAPGTPSAPKASDNTYTNWVNVTWSRVSGANSYRVYRCTSASRSSCGSGFSKTRTIFKDTGAMPGKVYYYRVKACNKFGCGKQSTRNAGSRKLSPPTPSASDNSFIDKIQISWRAAAGATRYKVFRCSGTATNTCGEGFGANATRYDDKRANPGIAYYFRIKSCNSASCSSYSSPDAGRRMLPTPSKPQTSNVSGGISVSWRGVPGAATYRIYRCQRMSALNSCGSGYEDSASPYKDTGGKRRRGRIHYYRVKACNGAACSGFSDGASAIRPLGKPGRVEASDNTYSTKVQITWRASDGATFYKVFRCSNTSKSSCDNGRASHNLRYNDTGATPGVTYYYRAKSCFGKVCSGLSRYDRGTRKQ